MTKPRAPSVVFRDGGEKPVRGLSRLHSPGEAAFPQLLASFWFVKLNKSPSPCP